MELPIEFCKKMQIILKDEYDLFIKSMEKPHFSGIRLNPLKCDEKTLMSSIPFSIEPAPFSPYSFYAPHEEKVGSLAAHHAGMFYSQEPSASSAVTVLDPHPGERVLDLCAAPGGKSTQIAGMLMGEGLLWSNEIVRSRAAVLLSNLERLGVCNSVVSSCHPQRLCEGLRGYFDRVLVDAPCSGEGMFRRNLAAIEEWTPQSNRACAQRQLAILDSAALAVKEGGVLVYSTCTFSPEENEDVIREFLNMHKEFQICPLNVEFGRAGLDNMPVRRIYPMDGGEGHFVAKLTRVGHNTCAGGHYENRISPAEAREGEALYSQLFNKGSLLNIGIVGRHMLLLPKELPGLSGLGVLRAGVELGGIKGNRIEPCHGLFMSRNAGDCKMVLNLSPESGELAAFLRGEEIDCDKQGYTAVCVNSVVVGFGKASGGRLKNRYPKGLRNKT